jgi:hypothetical protein
MFHEGTSAPHSCNTKDLAQLDLTINPWQRRGPTCEEML